MLLVFIVCVFATWYLRFYWKRRKLYKFASITPGPKNFPVIGCVWLLFGDCELIFCKVLEMMEKYRDIFKIWMGPKLLVSISKPSYLEIVLNSPSCLGKDDDLYRNMRVLTGTGLVSAPVPQWKKNRKLITPAFNQRILDSFVEIFAEQNKIFLSNLERLSGEKDIDILSLTGDLGVDTLCESNMGIKVGAQLNTSGSRFGFSEWIDKAAEILFIKTCTLWYQLDFIFKLTKLSKILEEKVYKIQQFTHKVVKEKRELFEWRLQQLRNGEEVEEEEFGKRKSFLDLLLQLSSEGDKLTDDQLRQEVDTVVIGGTDTTAATLCFCFVMLGMHQNLQRKILQEVVDVLGEDRDVTPSDLSHFDLLERFIKETLRLFPIVPLIFRGCSADVNLGDRVLPEGCTISVGIIGAHRDEKHWKDPLKFDPDRFLPEEIAQRHPYSYLPFAGGPRNCIGTKYAMMSMKITLAMVLRKFVIKTDYKSIEDIKLKANFLMRPVNGFKISVEVRE